MNVGLIGCGLIGGSVALGLKEKAEAWAKELTDWHEDFSPNRDLARVMDLHNNQTGRLLYREKFGKKPVKNEQITQALLPLLKDAKKLTDPQMTMNHAPLQLLYLNT